MISLMIVSCHIGNLQVTTMSKLNTDS